MRFFSCKLSSVPRSGERSLSSLIFFLEGLRITIAAFESFIVTSNPLPSLNIFQKAFARLLIGYLPRGIVSSLTLFCLSEIDNFSLLFKLYHELWRDHDKSLVQFDLPRGSLNRITRSFESAIIVKTTVDCKSNKKCLRG